MKQNVPLTDGRGHRIGDAVVDDETFEVEATVTDPYWMEMIYGNNDLGDWSYNSVWNKNTDGTKVFRECFPVAAPAMPRIKLPDADVPPVS